MKAPYWNIVMMTIWKILIRWTIHHKITLFVSFFNYPFVYECLFNKFVFCFFLPQCSWKLLPEEIELKRVIQQDVVRIFPKDEFFKTEKIQKIMNDILYYYVMQQSTSFYSQVSNFKYIFYFYVV